MIINCNKSDKRLVSMTGFISIRIGKLDALPRKYCLVVVRSVSPLIYENDEASSFYSVCKIRSEAEW